MPVCLCYSARFGLLISHQDKTKNELSSSTEQAIETEDNEKIID